MQYYEHLDTEWRNEDKFLELMVVDGCFLLEYFSSRTLPDGDPAKDIFLGSVGSSIKRDLLLIENQLPIQVIRQLYSWVTSAGACFAKLVVHCPQSEVFPGPPFPSAMDLSRTGIKFKVIGTYGLVDIHFDNERGFLSLPCIVVDEDTATLFLNLMALEKLDIMERNGVSSYVAFMGLLIRSAQDVKVLRSRRIIVSEESDDVIARLFNELGKNPVNDPDNCLYVVRSALARWSNSYIRSTGEPNSSKLTARIHGLLLASLQSHPLVATVTQAVYAVLQYYQDDLSLAPPNAFGP
ncbi:UPF0481-like protein [Cinnamomum micranthum f. kanehirae]|uniref:UPF0481-like protein n=1 Tax=Cinnamomum micranthum f. kanehirae TaxID=337451 RepID=A0A3S3P027_9MAGN|nr:UPF0481-like protein [Cinnamomum micranthum f. kanehirae]